MITFIDDQKNISAYLAKHSKVVTLNIADHGKKEIMDMIQADDEDGLLALSSPIEVIRGLICTVGKISVTEDEVLFDGTPVVDSITVRILEYVKNGWEVKHLASFLNKLYANPSFNSRQFLHKFLEHKHLPISEDGFFLAYKGVTEDYLDLHTRTFDNSVGQVHTIERKDVDDNPANYCSYGFHVGSLEYATGFGVRTMIVKIVHSKRCEYANMKLFQNLNAHWIIISKVRENGHQWKKKTMMTTMMTTMMKLISTMRRNLISKKFTMAPEHGH
jgi:hypothetical protein